MTATAALAPVDRIEATGRLVALALVALSLPWRSPTVSAGVALGAIVALGSHRALVRFVRTLVASGAPASPGLRLGLHFGKYAVIAAVVAAALHLRIANPVALLVGASSLLPAIARESLAAARAPHA